MKRKMLIYTLITICIILFFILALFNVKIEKIEEPKIQEQPEPTIKKTLNDDVLRQVLNNEKEFIDQDGKEILLNNLKIEDASVKVTQYTFVDLDGDSNAEVVALTDSYYDYSLILHIDNNVIYGYVVEKNKLQYINKLGVIYQKYESNISYRRFVFDKNKCRFIDIAMSDGEKYKIEEKEVTLDEFIAYQEEYIKGRFVSYKCLQSTWMEKKLMETYVFEKDKEFYTTTDSVDFLFMNNKIFDNFNSDLINDVFTLYYMDSNNHLGNINVEKENLDFSIYEEKLSKGKSVGLYDVESQYFAIIVNNDILESNIDNHFDIYYFKYYNKDIQFLGVNNVENIENFDSIFQDETLNNF